jgi:hypothetical protein
LHMQLPDRTRINPAIARALARGHTIDITFHLKGAIAADLAATARIITDEAERRAVFALIVQVWRGQDLEAMTRHSPLIEVTIDGLGAATAA